jgi:hypothetical protein
LVEEGQQGLLGFAGLHEGARLRRPALLAIETRKQLIEDVYQITGISDIVRGESDPRETATAQNVKSQWGSIRIRDRQTEMQRFARDLASIMGEIIADKFQPETLMEMTGLTFRTEAEVEAEYQQQLPRRWPPDGPRPPSLERRHGAPRA